MIIKLNWMHISEIKNNRTSRLILPNYVMRSELVYWFAKIHSIYMKTFEHKWNWLHESELDFLLTKLNALNEIEWSYLMKSDAWKLNY